MASSRIHAAPPVDLEDLAGVQVAVDRADFASGQRIDLASIINNSTMYKGIFSGGTLYSPGDLVTYGGQMWLNENLVTELTEDPGSGGDGWFLLEDAPPPTSEEVTYATAELAQWDYFAQGTPTNVFDALEIIIRMLQSALVLAGSCDDRLNALVIPTKTSELENDVPFIQDSDLDGVFISRFNNDSAYITNDDLDGVAISRFNNDVPYLPASDLPTDVSAFTNDAGYLVAADLAGHDLSEFANTTGFLVNADLDGTNISRFINDVPYLTALDLPTRVSDLTNDTGYLVDADLDGVNISRFNNDVPYLT